MAQAIGQVGFLAGTVKAVDSAGNERVLDINSKVFLGETIVTSGSGSRIMIEFDNQQILTMGRNDSVTLDSDIYNPDYEPTAVEAQESVASIESIQEALLNDPNFDPTQLEATAAGGPTGAGGANGESSSLPVMVSHIMQQLGFSFKESTGIENEIPQPKSPVYIPELTTEPPVTEPPATQPPVTEPPATEPPATQPPATEPPATQSPATEPPATQPPATEPPATQPPVTEPPVNPPEFLTGDDTTEEDGSASEINDDAITLSVEEDALEMGNAEEDRDQSTTDSRSFGLADADADDVIDVEFDESILPKDMTSGGNPINWTRSEDGLTMIGQANGETVIEITVSGNRMDGYSAQVDISGPVDHFGPDGQPIDNGDNREDDIYNTQSLEFGLLGSDGSSSDTLKMTIDIEDDAPVIKIYDRDGEELFESEGPVEMTLHEFNMGEDFYPRGEGSFNQGDVSYGPQPSENDGSTSDTSSKSMIIDIGADINPGEDISISYNGANIYSGGRLVEFDPETLQGIVRSTSEAEDDVVIYTLEQNEDGTFTFTLFEALDHVRPEAEPPLNDIPQGEFGNNGYNWDLQSADGSQDGLQFSVTGTDFDGDTVTGDVNVSIQDDVPVVEVVEAETPVPTFTVDYEASYAGYENTYGYYIIGENGEPTEGEVIWDNVKGNTRFPGLKSDPEAPQQYVFNNSEGYSPDQIGFFIISNGDSKNAADKLVDGTKVIFVDSDPAPDNENWVAHFQNPDGTAGDPIKSTGAPAYFSDSTLNQDRVAHMQSDNSDPLSREHDETNQNWEDLTNSTDTDYNDVMLNVQWHNVPLLVRDEVAVGQSSPDQAISGYTVDDRFNIDFGADGPAADPLPPTDPVSEDYFFSLDGKSGLVDTATGEEVILTLDNGVVKGYTNGVPSFLVFELSINSENKVQIEQFRAIQHDTADPNEITSVNEGAIYLNANAEDFDGDQAANSVDIGRELHFQDYGPTAMDDKDVVDQTIESDGDQVIYQWAGQTYQYDGGSHNIAYGNVLSGEGTEAGIANRDTHEAQDDGAKASVSFIRESTNGWSVPDVDSNGDDLFSATGVHGNLHMIGSGDFAGGYVYISTINASELMAMGRGDSETDNFVYQMTDADGDADIANLDISTHGVNDAPEFVTELGDGLYDEVTTVSYDGKTAGFSKDEDPDSQTKSEDTMSLFVREDALEDGNPGLPESDLTDEEYFGVADPDVNDTVNVKFNVTYNPNGTLNQASLPTLTSAGVAVFWALSVDGLTMTGSQGENGDEVLQVNLVANVDASGDGDLDYKAEVKISGAIDHIKSPNDPDWNDDDVKDLEFGIIVSDDNGDTIDDDLSDTARLTVSIEDDAPETSNVEEELVLGELVPTTTNLVFTLDISGSMRGPKIADAKEALKASVEAYKDMGDVNVQINTFRQSWITIF